MRERKYLLNEKELNDDIFGMAPASIEGLIVSVWAQGTGTYDNTGRRTDNNEEKSTDEDCCPGLGIGGAQARSQNAQAIAETTGERYESSYLELSESESRAGLEGAKEGILFIFGEWALVKVGTWAVRWVRVSRAAKGVTNLMPKGKLANHLFKGAGKLADNPANRTLIQKIANGKPLGVDAYGKSWYMGVDDAGKSVYTYTQNGIVKGAGYATMTPAEMIAKYGLK